MIFHDSNNLCLTFEEFVPEFMTKPNYDKARSRGRIVVYGRGGNGSGVYIDYEALPGDYKKAVVEKYGDPYKYIVKQPLTEWVNINWNKKAFDFYNNTNNKGYKLPSGLNLPEEYRDKYTKAATYLDGINHYTTDKLALKRDFNINMVSFWEIVADVIKAENVALPTNQKRLRERVNAYKTGGFEVLIEAFRFANDNSKKVKDQVAEDTLMDLIALDNKHDDTSIKEAYNNWALENGRKTITAQAVGYRRRTNYHEVIMAREGKAAAYNKYSMQIKQSRPTAPLMLVNGDDNVLDLFFIDPVTKNRYNRPVMYVIIDALNDYPLGYAIGETVTIDLIKAACRNAMEHIIEITGQPHIWGQMKTDKWAIDPALKGELATYFKMGGETTHFTASVAQSKYIERVFGKPLHKILKVFPNYSGANITARGANARPNPDALQKRSAYFPDKKHIPAVIEMAINALRHTVMDDGSTRQQQWLQLFNSSVFCKGRAITNERKLEIMGVKHQPKEPARLKVNGLNFQLNNIKYSFDIPASLFPQHNNKSVEIMYDPADMSQVLVTDHKGIRFVADAYKYQPSAIADMKPGDGERLHERLEEKRTITKKLIDAVTERSERQQRADIDAQSLMQAGVLTKAVNHQAQKVISGYNDVEIEAVTIEKTTRKPQSTKATIYDKV
ncbi:Mu transposase C-terminal domain-containing protein [Mucilaginibacter sp.]|uniref:Mu transposase C-terminal domain-containing protein n=1 Tax=Mucilaginibacter sp. TaxID=1882438 RepID=UPI0025D9764D|nr:Mu transposase C-terminal domain-containing protein [Mucilaginibacter sp.]